MSFWDGRRWTPPTPPSRTVALSRRNPVVDWVATAAMILGLLLLMVPLAATEATGAAITLTPSSGAIGSSVTVTGTGFTPNQKVQLTWDGSAAGMPQGRIDRRGALRVRFVVPNAPAGAHQVAVAPSLRLVSAAAVAASTFTVISPVAAPTSPVASASPSQTPQPTAVPTPTATPSPTPVPTVRPTPTPTPTPTPIPTVRPTPTPTPVPTPTPTPVPQAPTTSKLLFGLGPTVDGSRNARLVTEAPVRMLTTWYNGSHDLGWLTDSYHQGMFDQQYAAGRSLHLIVYTGDAETTVNTPYGAACGRPYPLSDRFLGDMTALASAMAGSGQLYVTLFTEFQTYACTDNAWNPNPQTNAYYRALKDRYRATLDVFHRYAPGSKVSLGWGGWQTRWSDAATGAGAAMFGYFGDVMAASDFQSFQAMQSDSNVSDVRAMVNTLNDWGPVMLAHYKPNNGSQTVFEADIRAMMTDAFIGEMTGAGLFAWSFMDQKNIQTESAYQLVREAVVRYGR